MRILIANRDKLVAEWVAARIPIFEFGSSPYTALGIANEAGVLLAGVVYQNYTKVDIHMHVAALPGRRWMSRHFLGECFRYPFEQLKCRRVTGLVPAKNAVAAKFDEHLGFTWEGRIRRILPDGDDVIVYGMLREECRFLEVGRFNGYQHKSNDFRRRA